jgi:opacity protein-like surface antigen
MKKLLTIFVISTLAASTAFADAHYNHYNNYSKPKNATATTATDTSASQIDNNNYYIRADAGASFARPISDKIVYFSCNTKTAPVINIGFGKSFTKYIRADITGSYREFKINNSSALVNNITFISNQKIKSSNLMLNGYYDVSNSSIFTPYLSVGIGAAYNHANSLTTSAPSISYNGNWPDKNTTNFAWQAGGGISAKVNQKFDLDLSYRFLDLGKVKTKQGTEVVGASREVAPAGNAKLRTNEVMLGIRYSF